MVADKGHLQNLGNGGMWPHKPSFSPSSIHPHADQLQLGAHSGPILLLLRGLGLTTPPGGCQFMLVEGLGRGSNSKEEALERALVFVHSIKTASEKSLYCRQKNIISELFP